MTSTLSELHLTDVLKSDQAIDKESLIISQDLTDKKYDIVKFIESLGFALTSTIVELRVNGVVLLSAVLANLPPTFLNETELNVVVTFYCQRLKDHHNVIPAVIDGISALIEMTNIPKDAPAQIVTNFFLNTTCQSQVRTDREKIFKILKKLSDEFTDELIKLGGDFIYNVINSIDGERDPRNLDYIFTFMPEFIKKFPLLHLAEEMFEIFACYYPIDFNPSKNYPAFITRDYLATKLALCLVASEEFAEHTIALLLEKLESDLVVAKVDSLKLLSLCAEHFSPQSMESHFEQIWPALKSEILPGTDSMEIIVAGLKSLQNILERASSVPEISKNIQTIVMGNILSPLNDASHRLFNPSSAIALACVAGDPKFASDKILNSFLITLKSETSSSDQILKLVGISAKVFQICNAKGVLNDIDGPIVQELQSALIELLNKEKSNTDLANSVLRGFQECIEITRLDNRLTLYQIIFQLLTNENSDCNLSALLNVLAQKYPNELKEKLFDNCMRNFPLFSLSVKEKIFENVSVLIRCKEFQSLVLELIFANVFKDVPNDQRILALSALKNILLLEDSEFAERLQKEYEIIEKIFVLVKNAKLDYETLESCATIMNLVVRYLPKEQQKLLIEKYLPQVNLQLTADLFITKGILGFLHQDINIDEHFERLLTDLTNMSLGIDDETLRLLGHHLVCSLLNKMDDSMSNRNVLEKILAKIRDEIKAGNKKAVDLLSWIAKGLSVRGYPSAGGIVESISELLDHPTLANAASIAFEIISAEYPQLHLPIIKLLYKQKLFHILLKKIGSKLETFSEHHLNAFVYVLKATPHTILKMNIEKVGPILFKCLDLGSPKTLLIALDICGNFIRAKDEYFSSHLGHLIPQCLKLSQYKESMQVRIKSLNLLEDVTKYPVYVLLPNQIDVTLALNVALDDKKRLVRNAAVKASNSWFLLGEAL